jgi:chloride channel 3/4/5
MIAAITLKFLDPFGTGKLVLFQVTYHKVKHFLDCLWSNLTDTTQDWHAYELGAFLLLGVIGVRLASCIDISIILTITSLLTQGVYGAFFSKLNYRWSRHVRNGTWLKDHPVAEVLLVCIFP